MSARPAPAIARAPWPPAGALMLVFALCAMLFPLCVQLGVLSSRASASEERYQLFWPEVAYGRTLSGGNINSDQFLWEKSKSKWQELPALRKQWTLQMGFALAGAVVVFSGVGIAMGLLLRRRSPEESGEWWRGAPFLRTSTWIITLYGWIYVGLYALFQSGYPGLLGRLIGYQFNGVWQLAGWPLHFPEPWVGIAAVGWVGGTTIGVILYRLLNGHMPTLLGMLGVELQEADPTPLLHKLPKLAREQPTSNKPM